MRLHCSPEYRLYTHTQCLVIFIPHPFIDLYHSKVLHIPPPKHIHTVGQPSSAGVTDEPRGPHSGGPRHGESSLGGRGGEGGGAVMGFAATELPRQNSTSIDIGDNKTGSMDSGTTTKSRGVYVLTLLSPSLSFLLYLPPSLPLSLPPSLSLRV